MWIGDTYINPAKVVAVVPRDQKKTRGGAVRSSGCTIWLEGGFTLGCSSTATEVGTAINFELKKNK